MKIFNIHIDETLSGRKIESLLENELSVSRSLIAKLKRTEGSVLLNGKNVTLVTRVNTGDCVAVNIPETYTDGIVCVKMELDILFEDEDILAVNKPADMPVHPVGKHRADTLMNGVMYYLKGKCHIITRLDRDTTGVVLMAKNSHTAKLLTEEMKKGNIQKEYIAVVNGSIVPEKGVIDAPIDRDTGIKRKVSQNGKPALTKYEVIKNGDVSVVRLFLETGRTHQIRVHMSYIGHPIYGDSMYGAPQKGERTRLHCHRISFVHPITGKDIVIKTEVPDDIKSLIKSLDEDV